MKDKTLEVIDEKQLQPNVVAISTLCEGGKNVLLWDFDIKNKDNGFNKVQEALISISQLYHLSKIYIIETRNGFNAICLDKFPLEKAYQIKKETAFDDKKHQESGLYHKDWRMRIGNDKKYIGGVITNSRNFHSKSNAHRIFLIKEFDLNITKDDAFDNSMSCLFSHYWCWKETYHE